MATKAVVGGTVIDGTGGMPCADAVVIVDDDRIRSVMPAADAVVPEHAEVIDAAGRYVIPGLMDANVHLTGWLPNVLLEHEGRYDEMIEEAAQVTLRSGVTTVFDTWGALEPLVTVRDRINRGEVAGSRLFVAGNIIGLGGPLSPDFFPAADLLGPDTVERINSQFEQGVGPDLLWLTPEAVRRRVRDYIERTSIDFVKYAASGHGQFRQFIAFSQPTQQAIVEESHRAGLTVQAHSTTVESLRMEIDAGADLLQHGDSTGLEPIPGETLKTIVDRSLPVAAVVSTDEHHAWVSQHGPEWLRKYVTNETRDLNHRNLIEAGARLLLATDGFVSGPRTANHPRVTALFACADPPFTLGESHFLWLEAVNERGMAPMDALLAATRNTAEAYGQATDLGTLEPGKRADLLILEGDPLEDVRNYRRIAEVMKDGALVDRDALPNRRIITAPADER
jgi:imidazolonepropionase-like amidohydrolase